MAPRVDDFVEVVIRKIGVGGENSVFAIVRVGIRHVVRVNCQLKVLIESRFLGTFLFGNLVRFGKWSL